MRAHFQVLALAAQALLSSFTAAESTPRNPIGTISTVENATIHTHNGRLTALSEFDLTFAIQNDLHVKLQLEPNHDILGEGATISYLAPDGTISKTENINRLDHKIYLGKAWVQRPLAGHDQWRAVGWARVVVAQDGRDPVFEGAFLVDRDYYHIQTASNYVRTRHAFDPEIESQKDAGEYMVVWRNSDIMEDSQLAQHQDLRRSLTVDAPSCQAERLLFNSQPDQFGFSDMKRRSEGTFGSMDFTGIFAKRQLDTTTGGNSGGVNLASTIGQTAGCPSTRKVALVGVATDCTYTAGFSSSQAARENALAQMNQASAVWERTFNISLGVQNIIVSDSTCPGTPAQATRWNQACSDSVSISDRLNYFSAWRGRQQDNNSHWTLLSTCNTGSAVGLAWTGMACVQTAFTSGSISTGDGGSSGEQTVSGANVVIRTAGVSEWQVIAHETGHTYGAVHDCYSRTCSDGVSLKSQQCCPLSSTVCDANQKYIMNPSAAPGISDFSMCSIGNICSALGRNSVNGTCLTGNRRVSTVNDPICGNGIVEAGEDCDCGGTSGCGNNKCCNPTTCKFTSNSVCDDANEDCCRSCQFASNGTVCRASTGTCDPQEVCTGTSAFCPADQTTPDGSSCGNGLQCASGQCTSRDQQCKSLMGSYTQGNDTYACDSSTCTLSCASPEFGYGVCYSLRQNFLDGTVCGGGGTCRNVSCSPVTTPKNSPVQHFPRPRITASFRIQHTDRNSIIGPVSRINNWRADQILDRRPQSYRHWHWFCDRCASSVLHSGMPWSVLQSAQTESPEEYAAATGYNGLAGLAGQSASDATVSIVAEQLLSTTSSAEPGLVRSE